MLPLQQTGQHRNIQCIKSLAQAGDPGEQLFGGLKRSVQKNAEIFRMFRKEADPGIKIILQPFGSSAGQVF